MAVILLSNSFVNAHMNEVGWGREMGNWVLLIEGYFAAKILGRTMMVM